MASDQRKVRRKLRILEHAEQSADVSETCRYFGVGRASFHRWRVAYERLGEAGITKKRSVPPNHPNKTPAAAAEKVNHRMSSAFRSSTLQWQPGRGGAIILNGGLKRRPKLRDFAVHRTKSVYRS